MRDTLSRLGRGQGEGAAARLSPAAWVALLILATTAMRIAFAAMLGLGIDESYMVAAGRSLRLGYFDHPPASWWLAAGAARLFGSEAPVLVRLPFILLFALSTWLMFRLGARLYDARAGLWAAVTLNLAPVLSVTTGGWVLPDGPLTAALLGAALCLGHALEAPGSWRWWLGSGLCAGLALFSKYSAALTLAGAFVYLLTQPAHRPWLARPQPYAAAALALLVFAPVLAWNAAHHWASFAFQGERAAAGALHPLAPFAVLAGEALFLAPWVWAPLMWSFAVALRRGPGAWRSWLPCCLGALPILAFALVALWSSQRVLFHWAAPGYLMLFPLLGADVARRLGAGSRATRVWLAASAGVLLLAVAATGTEARWFWLPLPAPMVAPGSDLEAADWTGLRAQFAARGLDGAVVGALRWQDAGKAGYALGPAVPVIVLGADPRQFGLTRPAAAFTGQDVVVLATRPSAAALGRLAASFNRVDKLPPFVIAHAGRPPAEIAAFLGRQLKPAADLAALPAAGI